MVRGVTASDLDAAVLDLAGPESLPRRELVARAARLHGRRPLFVPTPAALRFAVAAVAEKLSKDPPVTRAMLGVLEHDDVVDVSDACRRLGLELTSLDETLRRCVGPQAAP
jgi:uncharacterized protein YbjT (DUF2867 family)